MKAAYLNGKPFSIYGVLAYLHFRGSSIFLKFILAN